MAGFERKKIFLLKWDEHSEFHELEVFMRLGSIGEMIDSRRKIDELPADADVRPYMVAELARFLESWNLTMDGEPVPATLEGVMSADYDLVIEINNAHHEAISGALNKEKKEPSTSGTDSGVVDLPMEPLSENPKN